MDHTGAGEWSFVEEQGEGCKIALKNYSGEPTLNLQFLFGARAPQPSAKGLGGWTRMSNSGVESSTILWDWVGLPYPSSTQLQSPNAQLMRKQFKPKIQFLRNCRKQMGNFSHEHEAPHRKKTMETCSHLIKRSYFCLQLHANHVNVACVKRRKSEYIGETPPVLR